MNKFNEASVFHAASLARAKSAQPNKKQKFQKGTRVHIIKDLGASMSHFKSDVDATVEYTHAQAYGGDNYNSYSLNVDGRGSVAWYYENQLRAIKMKKETFIHLPGPHHIKSSMMLGTGVVFNQDGLEFVIIAKSAAQLDMVLENMGIECDNTHAKKLGIVSIK